MSPSPSIRRCALPCAAVVCAALLVSGCLATRKVVTTTSTASPAPAGGPKSPQTAAVLPKAVDVPLRLSPGDAWKSRFVSTSETKRVFTDKAGKETVKNRTVGLEITALQKVVDAAGTVVRIEITALDTRILQEGKFVPAPFLQFSPPNPVSFTIDTATGKADFSAMRNAYEAWMAQLKEGPAGDILGRTFRLPSYRAAIEDMYLKPFTRVAGRKLSDRDEPSGKDVLLPFLGPGAVVSPVPVEASMRYTGFDAKDGKHRLSVTGSYTGVPDLSSAEELSSRLSEFGAAPPATFQGSGSASGRFDSTVDLLSGREERSTGALSYTAKWTFDDGALSEEVVGKSILEPAE